MIQTKEFKNWLSDNTQYSSAVVSDNVSRMKRADSILNWNDEETYLYFLEKEKEFCELSVSVRSQVRKAVRLYSAYAKAIAEKTSNSKI